MRKLWLGFVFLFLTASTWAQVTITGQVVDTDGQQWIGGTYTVSLVTPSGSLAYGTFWNVNTGQWFQPTMQGILDGTGSFSVSLIPTQSVKPDGTKWKFTVCPQVTGAACGSITIPINAAGSVSSQINAVILAPRVTGGPGINAYSDIEVADFAPNTYFNVISQVNRCYSTSWGLCSGGGASPVSSVFGRMGAVAAQTGDYSVNQVTGSAPLASPAFTGVPTVPTATAGTNTIQAASTAFVLANALGTPSYTVGAGGVIGNTLVMGDGAGNIIPYVATSGNYGLYTGIATVTASATATIPVANGSGQLAACQFDGTPVVGDAAIGSTGTPGDCHDNGDSRLNVVGARVPVVGWVQSVSGTVGVVRLAGLGLWGSGNIIVNNTTSNQTLVGTLTLPGVIPAKLGNIFYADGFVSGLFAGIGVAQSAWSSATNYPQCSAVSYSGSNYLSVVPFTTANPGTASNTWYPVPDAATPTGAYCAFYTAAASIISGTGTVTNGGAASLIFGVGTYAVNGSLFEPTVSRAGNPVVNIFGQGKANTIIQLQTSASNPVIEQQPSLTAYAFASFVWSGFTVDANFDAPAVVGIYGAQQFTQSDLLLENAAPGSDHYIEWGNASDHTHSWVFEPDIERVNLNRTVGSGTGAVATAAVSGGTLTFTIVSGGSGYTSANTNVILGGTSDFGRACSSLGTTTATFTGTAISGITSSATGCVAPVYPIIFSGTQIAYGYKFSDVSDRGKIEGLTDGGVGATAGMYIASNVNAITVSNFHPISTLKGVENHGGATFNSLQCDTMYQYCFDNEAGAGTVNLNFPFYEWSTQLLPGSRDIYLAAVSGIPGYSEPAAFNVTGEACGNAATFAGYAHFDSSTGVIDATTGSDSSTLPVYVNDLNPQYCNNISTTTPAPIPTMLTQNFSFGNGGFGNQWNFGIGTSRLGAGGAGSQKLTVSQANSTATASLGIFEWDFSNTNPATSGNNYNSPLVGDFGAYWDGSVTQTLGVKHQLSLASGTGPLATYAFTHSGTVPAGGMVYSFDEPIKSTVTTGTAPFTVASTTVVANLNAATAALAANSTEIGGITVTGTPSVGMSPVATSSTAATWQAPAASSAPVMFGQCNGVATSSSAGIFLSNLGATSAVSCTSTGSSIGFVMPYSGTLSNLLVRCGTTGVSSSSGAFIVYDFVNGSATGTVTGITVTYGTTTAQTAVIDSTHTYSAAAGDRIEVAFTTQGSETLGTCSASLQY